MLMILWEYNDFLLIIYINLMTSTGNEIGKLKTNEEKPLMVTSSMKSLSLSPLKCQAQIKKTLISVPQVQTSRQAAQYQWRSKTQFPIVKISHYSIKTGNYQSSQFDVHMENYPLKLADFNQLPLFKVLYLLKESLIGFQRLFQRYGSFKVTSKMIAVNKMGKCKVWISQNFLSNQWIPANLDEKELVLTIFQLFQRFANKHKATMNFFQQIKKQKAFCSSIIYINYYIKAKKISVPNCYKAAEIDIVKDLQKSRYNLSLTMNHAPKFLISLRNSLKPNTNLTTLVQLKPDQIKQKEEQDEVKQTSLKMLKSENTTDLPSKKQNGLETEDQFLIQNMLEAPPSPQPLVRSHHQATQQENDYFRKLSNQYPSIKCLGSHRANLNIPKQPASSIPIETLIKSTTVNSEFQAAYNHSDFKISQSLWNKGLHGLFNNSKELKKSIHQGKEQRNLEAYKFELLKNFGKVIQESYIHEEMESSYQT